MRGTVLGALGTGEDSRQSTVEGTLAEAAPAPWHLAAPLRRAVACNPWSAPFSLLQLGRMEREKLRSLSTYLALSFSPGLAVDLRRYVYIHGKPWLLYVSLPSGQFKVQSLFTRLCHVMCASRVRSATAQCD